MPTQKTIAWYYVFREQRWTPWQSLQIARRLSAIGHWPSDIMSLIGVKNWQIMLNTSRP